MSDVERGPSPANEAGEKDEVRLCSTAHSGMDGDLQQGGDDEKGWRCEERLPPCPPEAPGSGQLPRPTVRRPSVFVVATTIIPRAQRRGLLGRLTMIPEINDPTEYKNGTKWAITAVVAMAAVASPMGSGVFYRNYIFLSRLGFFPRLTPGTTHSYTSRVSS